MIGLNTTQIRLYMFIPAPSFQSNNKNDSVDSDDRIINPYCHHVIQTSPTEGVEAGPDI